MPMMSSLARMILFLYNFDFFGFFHFIGTSSKVIYLKVILPEFLTKPPAFLEVTNLTALLECSARGASNKMSGDFRSLDGDIPIPFTTFRDNDTIKILAVVRQSGVYQCSITVVDLKI